METKGEGTMLILSVSLKDGPVHLIDDETGIESEVSVLEINRNQVKLGFDCDDTVTVLRHKVYERKNNNG